ncbi:MAG: hypothetical protein CMN30_00895 [Sandaracinus sp.]|nr:hypothetical protein [Sandaracinus sp.]|tara:strand:+ start:6764 stop:7201 length:438 start_codon:yes stop_codon:yes gene_type:complete
MTSLSTRLRFPSPGRPSGVGGALCALALPWTLALGCASSVPSETELQYVRSVSPSIELATTPAEEATLERAASLPVDQPVVLGDATVVAGPIYAAASGRRCRAVRIASAAERLVCEDTQTDTWVFVPNVLTAPVLVDAPPAEPES